MYILENTKIKVKFDNNGGIVELLDKRIDREYITESGFANIGRIMLPNSKWDGRFADLEKQSIPKVEKTEDEISFVFTNLTTEDGEQVEIEIKLRCFLVEDELFFKYEITNRDKNEFVSHIMFPIVTGIGKQYDECRLIMPEQSAFGDSRITDPFSQGDGNHKEWTRSNNRKYVRYPQLLTTAWMDYSDEVGGISFEQRANTFDICDMGFERIIKKSKDFVKNNVDCLQFALQSYPSAKTGEIRKSPVYVLSIHEKGWKTVALRHREWLKGVTILPEIPEKFKRSLGWHFFFMKQQDETVYRKYSDLIDMAQKSMQAGIEYMMTFGWYPHGHDNEYPFGYYASEEWGGEEYLKEQLEICQKMGCEVLPFFNGTLLDISTKGYEEQGYRWPVLGRTGKPYCGTEFSRANNDMGFANASISTSTRNMTLLDICITAEEVKKWWKETVERIVHQYGFKNLQLDQIAHKAYVCYDENHHHERPEYAYTKELQDLLIMVRKIVKGENGIMVGEGMTDLTAMYCDGFWNWHQCKNTPEIVRYSVPWMNYSSEVDANEYDAVNICFAERILLDLKIEGGDGIVSDFPLFSEHLKKLSNLKKKLGTAYIDGEYYLQDDIVDIKEEEGILVRLYKINGQCAVVVANVSDEVKNTKFEMNYKVNNVKIHDLDGHTEYREEEKYFSFTLPAYHVFVVEGEVGE